MENTNRDTTALFDASGSPYSTDIGRRLKSLITPPRVRRSPDAGREGSQTTIASRRTIATSAPATRKPVPAWCMDDGSTLKQSRSCHDIGRLEQIFEPRMAPYTPPTNLRRSEDSESTSSIPQEKLEKLELSLFEPRNSPCTPPLTRRRTRSDPTSPSAEEQREEERPVPAISPLARRTASEDEADSDATEQAERQKKLSVEQLQGILGDLRSRAQSSAEECARKIHQSDMTLTVRQVEKIASVGGDLDSFQRSYSGRMARRNRIEDDVRSRSVTVC